MLQYWDELDDAFHSLRFMILRSRLRWIGIAVTATLLGSCTGVF